MAYSLSYARSNTLDSVKKETILWLIMSADTICLDECVFAKKISPPDGNIDLPRKELVRLLKLQAAHETAAYARTSVRDLTQPLDARAFLTFKKSIIQYAEGSRLPIIFASTTGSFLGFLQKQFHAPITCLLPMAEDESAQLHAIDTVLGTDAFTLFDIYHALNPTQEHLLTTGITTMGADNPLISKGIILNLQVDNLLASGIQAYADRMAKFCHAHLFFEEKACPEQMAHYLLKRVIAIGVH